MKTNDILKDRHKVKLKWVEPWPACHPDGSELHANIELRASAHDCINMSRLVAKSHNLSTFGDDARHLDEFMAVNWATAIDSNPLLDAMALAKKFHNIYENLALEYGYKTNPDTKEFNMDSPNAQLMVATCAEIIKELKPVDL